MFLLYPTIYLSDIEVPLTLKMPWSKSEIELDVVFEQD